MLEATEVWFGGRPAIAWFGRRLTYRWLLGEVERFSAVLVDLGVRAGDRVALILANTPLNMIAYYACARIGAIAVGNNPLYTEPEIKHQLRDTQPTVVVILDEFHSVFAPLFAPLRLDAVVVTAPTDYMAFPRKQLASLVRRRRARVASKQWPPVTRGAGVRWWTDLMSHVRTIAPVQDVDPSAPGEHWEFCVRGPQVMLGYWRRPEETAAVIRDGWLHTGDIAVMERDGYFRIVDRP